MNNTDGNLAALAVYEKEQEVLDRKADAVDAKENDIIEDIKSGTYEDIDDVIEYLDEFINLRATKAVEKDAKDAFNEWNCEDRDK
jgi:hypothetical protein